MPLIDLKTDLKSLRYGKDTPGGGYSGQPYIQANIPEGFSPKSPDFLLRNGYLSPFDALKDVERLTKMFFDLKSFNGAGFIAKQLTLSNSAVRTQTSGIINEGIYTPLNTLSQAGVIAGGYHLNKQGINPFELTGAYSNNDNLYGVKVKYTQPKEENRLVALYDNITDNLSTNNWNFSGFGLNVGPNVLTYNGGPGAPLGVGNTNIRFADQRTGYQNSLYTTNKNYFEGKNTKQTTLDYAKVIGTGGVSGKYARLTKQGIDNKIAFNIVNGVEIGQQEGTFFFNVYDPSTIAGNTWPKNTELIYANNTATYNQTDLINESEEEPNAGKKSGAPKIYDFRRILRRNLETSALVNVQENAKRLGQTPDTTAYTDKYYEKRVNIGGSQTFGPGNSTGKNLVSYTNGSGIGPVDKINALSIYRSQTVAQNSEASPVNDLVKFRIAAIDGSSPNFKTFIHFRAFIDSFGDSYSADWNSVRYLGRGEKFYNYDGFDRKISLSFTVAAQSKEELIPMYKKLNYLASNLAPDYSPYGYMRGPLVQLTMGGYLYEQVGFITNLTYDIPNDSPWEIGINDSGNNDPTVKELPHRISVSSFSFTPIHNFVPGKQGLGFNSLGLNDSSDSATGFVTKYGDERFIALSNGVNENYNNTP
jgi:hypothetical protein